MPFVYIFFQASSGKCTSVVQGSLVLLYFILFAKIGEFFALKKLKLHFLKILLGFDFKTNC